MSETIRMPRSAGGRQARPATWWITARGNIRFRCPACAKTSRLILRGLTITSHGTIPQPITHYGCERLGILVLEGITGEERMLLFGQNAVHG